MQHAQRVDAETGQSRVQADRRCVSTHYFSDAFPQELLQSLKLVRYD